jgi:hypothetical protein
MLCNQSVRFLHRFELCKNVILLLYNVNISRKLHDVGLGKEYVYSIKLHNMYVFVIISSLH